MDTLSHLIHLQKHVSYSKQIQQNASLPLAFLLGE